jgi:hypothetical protein
LFNWAKPCFIKNPVEPSSGFFCLLFSLSKKVGWTKAEAALDSFEKGMDAVRAAHQQRSQKQKNEPKLVFIKFQRKFETLFKNTFPFY